MEINDSNASKTSVLLITMSILFVVFQGAAVVISTIKEGIYLTWILESVIAAVLLFSLFFSYKSHTKNVMKPLLGATLMMVLVLELSVWDQVYGTIRLFVQYHDYVEISVYNLLFLIFKILIALAVTIMNIMHYVINASHHSSPKKVRFNSIIFVVFTFLLLFECMFFAFLGSIDGWYRASCIMGTISDVFIIGVVFCIEQSMDEFKIAREEKLE